jgi:DNA-binding NtrC family response regulator
MFLDEIGEMRPDMQVRLLRALENREIRRVGGDRTIKVNTRVISATNQNIQANIKHNLFRVDLYYRLAILVLEVPALRDRREDVGQLAQHFLDEARKDGHTRATRISPQALDVLMKYPWPGNVRELRNAIERAVVFEDTFMIMPSSLPPEIIRISLGPQAVPPPKLTETFTAEQFKAMLAQSNAQRDKGVSPDQSIVQPLPAMPGISPQPAHVPTGNMTPPPGAIPVPTQGPLTVPGVPGQFDPSVMRGPADGEVLTLDEEEKRIILRTLSITGGNISEAARRLGVHRSTLHRKMTRYGLATDEQLTADAANASDEA